MDLPERTRIYAPVGEPLTRCLLAVVVPTADPDESLLVELYDSGNVSSSWGETHLTEQRCRSSGLERDDAAELPASVQTVIERRYPEHLEWIGETGPRAPGA